MPSDHYSDVIMSTMASQITSPIIVYSTVYSGADQRKHQSSASLAFVWGIHRGPVNSPRKWSVTRKMFPFDDVIMNHLPYPFISESAYNGHKNAFFSCRVIYRGIWFMTQPYIIAAIAWIIWCMRTTDERRRYIVTSSLIGSAYTENDPCIIITLMSCDLTRWGLVKHIYVSDHNLFRQWIVAATASSHHLN